MQRLVADIEDWLVDVVVVYKIDRLSRALTDFARLLSDNGSSYVAADWPRSQRQSKRFQTYLRS